MNIVIIGNLTADPDLRFTPNGAAVANFQIAENHRKKQGDEWVDDGATFWRCTAWRELAEGVAELRKGQRVIAHGRTKTRAYATREGENRTILEVEVDELGPSSRVRRQAGGNGQGSGWSQQQSPAQQGNNWGQQPSGADPWAQAQSEEPPF